MTDRHAGYVVVLDRDIREDDAEATLNALRMVRGVIRVEPVVADPAMMLAEGRARMECAGRLRELAREIVDLGGPRG